MRNQKTGNSERGFAAFTTSCDLNIKLQSEKLSLEWSLSLSLSLSLCLSVSVIISSISQLFFVCAEAASVTRWLFKI